jgi:hypothetical protein
MSKVFKAVGNAVSSVVKGVVKAVTGIVKAVVNVVASVVNFIAQPFMGLLGGMPDMPNAAAEADRQQGVLIQRTGSVTNIPVIYGYRKVAGSVTFAETGSTSNRYLWVAYVFAEGPVEGLREVFIDDIQLPASIIGQLNLGNTVNINEGKYAGRVQLQWFPGTYFSNPSQSILGSVSICKDAPSWKESFAHNGMAVLFARYEWKEIKTQADADSNPFSGSIPEIQICILGQRVASLIVDNPQQFSYESAPVRYSTNPAEILLDYLRNPRYGKGLNNDDIDWDSWRRAAAKCNQAVTYINGVTGPILTCNFVLDTGQTIFSNVKTLLMGFRAYMPYVQGKYKLKIEDAGNENDILSGVATIVQTFNKDSIVNNVTYTGIEKSNKYNHVVVTYVDPDQKFSNQQVVFPETEAERQVFINLDGNRENKLEATFPTLTNYAMAKDMARLLFNKSRRQETCSLTVTSQALELEPGDNIRIQSNILDFGSDPWRVISLKVNNDMSVELGCVRNPDDIYPHARVGEEDIVLPVYVPQGATIYYPSSYNTPQIGLVPPERAYIPPNSQPSNPVLNPPPSPPPSGGGGGGVGGIINPISPVAPPIVPPPTPLNDVVVVSTASIRDHGNNTVSFNLSFTQPQNSTYQKTIFYFRSSPYDAFRSVEVTDLAGPGQTVSFSIGPVVKGLYDFFSRVYFSGAGVSTLVGRFQIDGRVTGNTSVNVTQLPSVSATGWTLPGVVQPPPPRYDARFDTIRVNTVLNGSVPFTNRRLNVTLKQDVLVTPANYGVSGVRMFYRAAGTTYYEQVDHLFGSNYVPGQTVTFQFPGDVGQSLYPTIPNSFQQNYDFVFRFIYRDNSQAQYQVVQQNKPTEYNAASGTPYTFDVFNTGIGRADTLTSATVVQTVDQAPPGAIVDPRDFIPSIVEIANGSVNVSPRIRILVNAPDTTNLVNWRGLNVRYRQVLPGQNPPFRLVNTGVTVVNDRVEITLTDWEYGKEYEIALTDSVRYAGNTIDATNSLIGKGTVNPSGQLITNWYSSFNFQQKPTTEALRTLATSFPALPTINVGSWFKRHVNFPTDTLVKDIEGTTTSAFVNAYYELKYQVPPTGYQAMRVYRRVVNKNNITKTTTSGFTARYHQVGPWEMIRVTSYGTADANGFFTLQLRPPIDWRYFNPGYEVTGSNYTNTSALIDPTNRVGGVVGGALYFPIAPSFTTNASGSTTPNSFETQFLFVLEKTGGGTGVSNVSSSDIEPRGKLLLGFNPLTAIQNANGFNNGVSDQTVSVSDFINVFPSGYGRNLQDALINVSFIQLRTPQFATFPASFTGQRWPQTWPNGPITRYLAAPASISSTLR